RPPLAVHDPYAGPPQTVPNVAPRVPAHAVHVPVIDAAHRDVQLGAADLDVIGQQAHLLLDVLHRRRVCVEVLERGLQSPGTGQERDLDAALLLARIAGGDQGDAAVGEGGDMPVRVAHARVIPLHGGIERLADVGDRRGVLAVDDA